MRKYLYLLFPAVILSFSLGMLTGATKVSTLHETDSTYVDTIVKEDNDILPDDCVISNVNYSEVSLLPNEPNVPTFVVKRDTVEQEWIYPISEDEIDLIAQLVMAEAEGEPEEGKRLVIDTVLNRVDHPHYPDNVYDVIYAPAQFSPIWNGRFERCYVKYDIKELVKEELLKRANNEVIYFNAKHYSDYGTPLFQVGNHYFSKRD